MGFEVGPSAAGAKARRFTCESTKAVGSGSITLEIRASDGDVQRYLDGHMFELPSLVVKKKLSSMTCEAEASVPVSTASFQPVWEHT
jgi:hypothetical protein